jgi:hypothetical protein
VIANGKRFACEVGVETFTPPELQGKNLREVVRTANHDNFGLAIMVFLLLFIRQIANLLQNRAGLPRLALRPVSDGLSPPPCWGRFFWGKEKPRPAWKVFACIAPRARARWRI